MASTGIREPRSPSRTKSKRSDRRQTLDLLLGNPEHNQGYVVVALFHRKVFGEPELYGVGGPFGIASLRRSRKQLSDRLVGQSVGRCYVRNAISEEDQRVAGAQRSLYGFVTNGLERAQQRAVAPNRLRPSVGSHHHW